MFATGNVCHCVYVIVAIQAVLDYLFKAAMSNWNTKPWSQWTNKSWKKQHSRGQHWGPQRRGSQHWGEQDCTAPPASEKEPTQSWKHSTSSSAAQPKQSAPHADSKTRKADREKSGAVQPASAAKLIAKKAIRAAHASTTCMEPTCCSNVPYTPAPHASRADNTICKADRGKSSAVQPASGVSDGAKQFQGDRCLTCVAYVKIPTFQRWGAKNTSRLSAGRSVLCTIKHVKERGVDIINIVFERADDLKNFWYDCDMETKTQEMGFLHNKNDKLLTLHSTRCGRVLMYNDGVEDGVPALMLRLEKGPHENLGDMIIVNAASRELSSWGRNRMLDLFMGQGQYCDALLTESNSVCLIGGDLGESLFLEHYQERQNNGFHLSTGDSDSKISVFARTDDEIEQDSYQRNSREADITVVQLWRSATYDSGAHWTLEEEITKRATKYGIEGGQQMMEVCLKSRIDIRPPPQCQQRRLALDKGLAEPVLLALHDRRRIGNRNLLGARQTELCSLLDAAQQPQLGDAPRQHQLTDYKSHSNASRQLQLPDGDSYSEKPPVKEDQRDSDFRSPDLKANLKSKTPKWDNFIENLSTVTSSAHVREFIDFLRTKCFTKPELLWTNANGDHLEFELPFALKMEQLFDTAEERRWHALQHLKPGYDLTRLDETYEISEKDMKEVWQLRLLSDVF